MPNTVDTVRRAGQGFSTSFDKLTTKLNSWVDSIVLNTPNFILALLVFVLFVLIAKYAARFAGRILKKKVEDQSIIIMGMRILRLIIIVIGFFLALGILDLDKILTSILAAVGVMGLAIGLAMQSTLSNTFAGIIISFVPRIRIGDWVESNGFSGFVRDINLRSVIIQGADNNMVVIPNSKILDSPIKNFSLSERSRITIKCGIGYECDLAFVKKITVDIFTEKYPQQGAEEIEFFYTEYAGSSINYMLRFWVDCKAQKTVWQAQSDAIMLIDKLYKEHKINIPFPIRTLDFGKNNLLVKTEGAETRSL